MKAFLLSICLAFVLVGFAQQKPATTASAAPATAEKAKHVQNPAAWALSLIHI